AGALQDPTLELHDASGLLVASNDNWKSHRQAEIEATTIPPADDRESAIVQTLAPGNYTAIVRGKNDSTGVALVETYHLPDANTPLGRFLLPIRGLYTQIERRGWGAEYWSGQLMQTFNNFDSVVGSTPGQEASLQLDKMREMGVNIITFELRTASPTYNPGPFVPPECNIGPVLGFQWPQPTATELSNIVTFFDLAQSKGIHVWLRLVNTHMEEQPPTNSQTWLGSILGALKNHPALDLVLFEGDQHVNAISNTCGVQAEPPLWMGRTEYAAQYVKWAINFARGLGIPPSKLSAEAIVGGFFVDSQPFNQYATDGHLWSPIVVLKQIFDDLNIPNSQRTYALSFYSERKCSDAHGIACVDTDPHTWADQTLQQVFATIGIGTGARVVAPEMGLLDPPTAAWTSERALEDILALMQKYGVSGGSYWKWVAIDNQEDADKTKADPIKKRGLNFIYNPVQKEILDVGGFHLTAISNGSFEAGNSIPSSWAISGSGTGARYFLAGETGQPEVPSRGQYDLRLVTGSGPNDMISATSNAVAVTPGTAYTTTSNLRFSWMGDPNPGAQPTMRPQAFLAIHYFDGAGNPSMVRAQDTFRYFQENSTNGFATFPIQYTAPSDASTVRLEFGAARNGLSTAITVDVDNIR
ncbi:MAG: hypothetical protein ACR2MF_06650, partial [Chthoniobacterales bacterium]